MESQSKPLSNLRLKELLDSLEQDFNRPEFIKDDPISIPHKFKGHTQNMEIMGLLAAIFAWGKRSITIQKCEELINLLGGNPYQFIIENSEQELKRLPSFRHRTFLEEDLHSFLLFFKRYYTENESLERLFLPPSRAQGIEHGLINFRNQFITLVKPEQRTLKHIANPAENSSCKRLLLFLKWMVRRDNKGVDFGIWKKISPSALILPCDLHVLRACVEVGMLPATTKLADWKMAVALTERLKAFDPQDPVKYDYALFGLSIFLKNRISGVF